MKNTNVAAALVLLATGLCVTTPALAQPVIYVDADATGPTHDGSSWCSAYTSLDEALSAAAPGVAVLMADGVYTPDPTGLADPREATFELVGGVEIEGSYAGCGAPDPYDRDHSAHPTVLTGDLAGDDGPNFANYDENCYHVVTAIGLDTTTKLDGVTVTGGNANGDWTATQHAGGGMLNVYSSVQVWGCTFVGNRALQNGIARQARVRSGTEALADDMLAPQSSDTPAIVGRFRLPRSGGAVLILYDNGTSAEIAENDLPVDGDAVTGGGGSPTAVFFGAGMANLLSDTTLVFCLFSTNTAYAGGGMFNLACSPTVDGCSFSYNTAEIGGGMHTWSGSPNVAGAFFIGNHTITSDGSTRGGAVYCSGGSSLNLNGCLLIDNSASLGGGVAAFDSSPTLTGCRLEGNTATYGAGMYTKATVGPVLTNCIFSGNTSSQSGGGLYIDWSNYDGMTIAHCTFSGNTATSGSGGGVYSWSGADSVVNCILWGNSGGSGGAQYAQVSGLASSAVQYTCIQDQSAYWPDPSNIGDDPLFVGATGAPNDDLHLLAGSPCINAGSNYAPQLPDDDIEGNTRLQHCRVDMGAYETPYTPPMVYDCNNNSQDDDCDVYTGTSQDCDRNHVPDECDPDCDGNGVPDRCDVDPGDPDGDGQVSPDCNTNLIPDYCDVDPNDPDGDGLVSADCDANGVPDECDTAGSGADCNQNGVPDVCDLDPADPDGDGLVSPDCNTNNLPDECDITGGTSGDCNINGIPDECDLDPNDPDGDGSVGPDCNANGVLDECDGGRLVTLASQQLAPIGYGFPQSFVIESAPSASGDVLLSFTAYSDLNSLNEYIMVNINGTAVGTVFATGAHACPASPDTDQIVVPAVTYNTAVNGGDAVIEMVATYGVDEGECWPPQAFITVTVQHEAPADCNSNGVLDECDISAGTSNDADSDGLPDECLPAIVEVHDLATHSGSELHSLLIYSAEGPVPNVEPRLNSGRRLRVTFDRRLDPSSATDPGNVSVTGSASGPYQSWRLLSLDETGHILAIKLGSLPDRDCYTVTIGGITSLWGAGPVNASFTFTKLVGDVNRDGMVTSADISSINQRLGNPVDDTNFQYDANRDLAIDVTELMFVMDRLGNTAPLCP